MTGGSGSGTHRHGQRGLINAPPRLGRTISAAIDRKFRDQKSSGSCADRAGDRTSARKKSDMQRTRKGESQQSILIEAPQRKLPWRKWYGKSQAPRRHTARRVSSCLDSIHRLARATNGRHSNIGKVISASTSGIDANALQRPRRFFAAAASGRVRSLHRIATR